MGSSTVGRQCGVLAEAVLINGGGGWGCATPDGRRLSTNPGLAWLQRIN